MEALQTDGASPEEVEDARKMLDFWAEQETRKNLRKQYPAEIAQAMPEDIYWEHAQIAFPLYRVVGAYLDYNKLLRLGLDGMRSEVERCKQKAAERGESGDLFDACRIALDTLSKVCLRYASACSGPLAEALRKIAHEAPETFLEAMQLAWLYSLISGVLNYGRMDDYLGDFLGRDLDNGVMDRQKALDLTWQPLAADRCPKDRVPRPGHYRRQRTAPGRKCGPVCAPGHGGQPHCGGGGASAFPALL